MAKQKLVLVGNGMAGVRCIEEMIKLAPDAFDITIFGSEPYPNYNRIMLSKVLQGDTDIEDITIHDWQWYEKHHIRLYAGETVIRIDTSLRQVYGDQGTCVTYDKLIIATGSLPFMLPLPGVDKANVTAFRNIADCRKMVEASKTYRKAIVIGGGLLGLEAARGLLNLGMEVSVVHIHNYLMERQLDPTASKLLQQELEQQGMRFLLNKKTERIYGRKRAEGLEFHDGKKEPGDLIVMAVGIRPNIRLAADAGIEVNRAIVVNDWMETSVEGIYAVGECAEHRGAVYGLVAPLYEQGKVLANRLCGVPTEGYRGSILSSKLKVSGVDVFSAGEIRDEEITTSVQSFDGVNKQYRKLCIRDDKIVGALLFGDLVGSNKLTRLIDQKADISALDTLSQSEQDSGYVANIAHSDTICSCNGVSKGRIVEAIGEHGLQTFEQVRECTKASSSCGSCQAVVTDILRYVLEHEEDLVIEEPAVCSCTEMSHSKLKEAVGVHAFSEMKTAMRELNWNDPEGCPVCRAALRYYIGLSDMSSTMAGNTVNLLPSADGTYSLVPRIYGGVVEPDQLRRIAIVMERYKPARVQLMEGGYIRLFGLRADDADMAANELRMPVAKSTYGHPVPSVSVCGGKPYDPYAMQDSVDLAKELERQVQDMQFPTWIRIGVYSSPMHEADGKAKDIGIIGVPGGWELYVGRSKGAHQQDAQLICTLPDKNAVCNITSAFLQWYREDAYYGETIGQWVERIGIIPLREGLFHVRYRSELLQRQKASATMNNRQPKVAGLG